MDEDDQFGIWEDTGNTEGMLKTHCMMLISMFIWLGLLSLYVVLRDIPQAHATHQTTAGE
jgi:hypothetical protein